MSEQAKVHLFYCTNCKILLEDPSNSSVYKCRGCGHIFHGQQGISKVKVPDRVHSKRRDLFRSRMIDILVALCLNDVITGHLYARFGRHKTKIHDYALVGALLSFLVGDVICTNIHPRGLVSIEHVLRRCLYCPELRLFSLTMLWDKPLGVPLIFILIAYDDYLLERKIISHVVMFVSKQMDVQLGLDTPTSVNREMKQEDHCQNDKEVSSVQIPKKVHGDGCLNMNELINKDPKDNKKLVSNQGNVLLDANSKQAQLCLHFTFAEIQLATHNFDNSCILGKGGFGKVYKGSFDGGTTTVAIKRLDPSSKQGQKEFWTEIEMLSKFRHSHIVSLIGYCNDSDEMIIVYEYMSRGSLADHLHPKDSGNAKNNTNLLCWVQRLKICIGAARGLDYLHSGTSILQSVIHRDVKTSNILLDENWASKVSDFGLSKIGPADQSCTSVITSVKGTRGYIDPDYVLTHRLTRKSDVYAFGVVLFQVLSGRHALDERLTDEQRCLTVWARYCILVDKVHYLIDHNLKWEIFPDSLKEFVKIAEQCLHSRPKKRPTMSEVVASLESALTLQERKNSSFLDDYDFEFMTEKEG